MYLSSLGVLMGVVLYGFWRSLATYRVRVALNFKKISYEERSIDLVMGEQFDESFSQINPQHVLPPYLMPPADSELQTNTFGEPVHRDEARDKLSLPATMGKRPL